MSEPLGSAHLRIARPTRDLGKAEEFWVQGIGLEVLWRSDHVPVGGHDLTMVGHRDLGWHLELVADAECARANPPGPEDLLVLYLGTEASADCLARIQRSGGRLVEPRNPYWAQWGVTVADPDGYLLVLSSRAWSSAQL